MIVESYEDVVKLSGSLRSNFWETIHTAIALTLKRHPTGVIVDCGGITEVTTDGADTFTDAIRFVEDHDSARIILAAVPGHMVEVLKHVPNVRSQLPIVATVEEARRSLDLLVKGEEPRRRKRESPREFESLILACLSGEPSDETVLQVTGELIGGISAKVVFLFPISVPRDKPVSAPLPDLEERGARALEEGAAWMARMGIPSEVRLERGRDLASVLGEVADEVGAARVVLAVAEPKEGDDLWLRTVASVIEKVRPPVVIVRGPRIGGAGHDRRG